MTLALECLRETIAVDDDDDEVREDVAFNRVRFALDAFLCALPGERADDLRVCAIHARRRSSSRLLRARLALALRVLLRADAGDFGPVSAIRCMQCRLVSGLCTCTGHLAWWRCEHKAVLPLWESAPPHGKLPPDLLAALERATDGEA
jgi:hypothetical protein